MSRRRAAVKRQVLPDPKYKDTVASKFINGLMLDGKRGTAEAIFYGALDTMAANSNGDALALFHQALDNTKPELEVRSRRVGGATYQVPVEVRADRSQALAIRWLVGSARKRSERTMQQRLANELTDAANNRGAAIKKREDTHKMADANKAFAHFKW